MKLLFIAILTLLTLNNTYASTENWEEIDDSDGIKVFKKDIPGSDLVAFKGSAIINASAQKVLWVLTDPHHRTDWVDRLMKNVELETISELEKILYQSFKMPFIISNRDFVYKSTLRKDKKTGNYHLHMRSVKHPNAPETIGVRAELINSYYFVEPLKNGQSRIVVEIQSDPKGWLPTWLVNLVQKSWPYKTLKGLRNQVKKKFVKEFTAAN